MLRLGDDFMVRFREFGLKVIFGDAFRLDLDCGDAVTAAAVVALDEDVDRERRWG